MRPDMPPLHGNVHCNCTSAVNNTENDHIKHHVSKLDTLAGVAIKYGVEVADIKRLNGLATDLQMFALKTLLIPLRGRHSPSSVLSNVSDSPGGSSLGKILSRPGYSNVLDSFESLKLKSTREKVSPAMSTLRKYYGIESSNHSGAVEGTEMAVYRTASSDHLTEGLLTKTSPISRAPYHYLKFQNYANGLPFEDGDMVDYLPLAEGGDEEGEKSNEKSVRRRQKSETDFRVSTPERLLKEENNGGSSNVSPAMGKCIATRNKSGSRAMLSFESESGWLKSVPVGLGDSIIANGLPGVGKSSTVLEQSIWPAGKWNLKLDLQVLPTATITMPTFDGLPKPVSGRRSKAALD